MSELEMFKCTFLGRRIGAIGEMYSITETVVCTFDRIVPTLYKKYEHITNLQIVDSENRLVDVKLARENAYWNDD